MPSLSPGSASRQIEGEALRKLKDRLAGTELTCGNGLIGITSCAARGDLFPFSLPILPPDPE